MNVVVPPVLTVKFAEPSTAFWKVIGNTFAYLGLGVPISMLLAFVVAYFLDRVRFGHGLLRALYFIPHLTTAVAMAWVWRWFYQPVPVGSFNDILVSLSSSSQVQPSYWRSSRQPLHRVCGPSKSRRPGHAESHQRSTRVSPDAVESGFC